MKTLRSRGFDPEKPATVTIRLQQTDGEKPWDRMDVIRMIRRIRHRYGNTGGVEYEVELQSAESTMSISSKSSS